VFDRKTACTHYTISINRGEEPPLFVCSWNSTSQDIVQRPDEKSMLTYVSQLKRQLPARSPNAAAVDSTFSAAKKALSPRPAGESHSHFCSLSSPNQRRVGFDQPHPLLSAPPNTLPSLLVAKVRRSSCFVFFKA
jgi:hypothetical protein